MCVEREESEESLERRRNWDHARHEERVNLGLSTDAVCVSITGLVDPTYMSP